MPPLIIEADRTESSGRPFYKCNTLCAPLSAGQPVLSLGCFVMKFIMRACVSLCNAMCCYTILGKKSKSQRESERERVIVAGFTLLGSRCHQHCWCQLLRHTFSSLLTSRHCLLSLWCPVFLCPTFSLPSVLFYFSINSIPHSPSVYSFPPFLSTLMPGAPTLRWMVTDPG